MVPRLFENKKVWRHFRDFKTNRTCSLSDYLNSAVGELFTVFEFSFMVLHERPIDCVDLNYESRGVSPLDAKSYDFICVTAGQLSIVFQFTPICKSPLYVNRPYM